MGSPVLGLRGSGSFGADGSLARRPENWREGYFMLYPNGKAPLTALMAMLKSERTNDAVIHFFEKELAGQRMRINNGGGYGAGAVSVTVDATSEVDGITGAKSCRRGMTVMLERTGEIVYVTDDPVSDTALLIERSFGTTGAAGINDNDWMLIIGTAHEEGASLPSAIGYDPRERTNFTQIFRSPDFITRTASKTKLRTGDQKLQAKKEALEHLSIQKERALIFGEKKVTTGPKGQPLRTMQGMVSYITQFFSDNVISSIGALSETAWDTYLEQLFRYGSTEKLLLCGSTALMVLSTMAKKGGIRMQQVPSDESYGMNLVKYITPFGTVFLKSHPLFNEHPEHRKNILAVDPAHINERYMDDVSYLKDRQTPGDDAVSNEWLNECCIEVHHAKTHMWMTGITSFAP